ncbi:hypothetical protein FJY69_00745 [candidate division WOR-3 bacterium]|nr:hypothetical protein [candidate division WOR-3 bacterium]
MIVEKNDIAAVRLAEIHGLFPTDGELAGAGLKRDEFRKRLAQLVSAGVVKGIRATVCVPPLLGGDWVWAMVMGTSRRSLGVANALAAKLPFVSEVVLNSGLPEGLGPNLAVLFYSRDFDSEARFIQSMPGFEYREVQRIAGYSFPMAMKISADEKELVRFLVRNPNADADALSAGMGKDERWVRAKLERLVWREENRCGVVRFQVEANWGKVDNFGHCHFLLETGHRPEQLERLVGGEGFELVLGGAMYRNRYVQVEADVWGMGRLLDSVAFLEQIEGIRVAGVVWNREVVAHNRWVDGLLK